MIKVATTRIPDNILHWRVSDIINNGKWDIERVKDLIPMEYSKDIMRTPLTIFGFGKERVTLVLDLLAIFRERLKRVWQKGGFGE